MLRRHCLLCAGPCRMQDLAFLHLSCMHAVLGLSAWEAPHAAGTFSGSGFTRQVYAGVWRFQECLMSCRCCAACRSCVITQWHIDSCMSAGTIAGSQLCLTLVRLYELREALGVVLGHLLFNGPSGINKQACFATQVVQLLLHHHDLDKQLLLFLLIFRVRHRGGACRAWRVIWIWY